MQPEKVFRIGLISASIFANEIESDNGKRTMRNVNLQRRYRDEKGEWNSATSFGLADLPVVAKLVDMATDYIAEQEASSR